MYKNIEKISKWILEKFVFGDFMFWGKCSVFWNRLYGSSELSQKLKDEKMVNANSARSAVAEQVKTYTAKYDEAVNAEEQERIRKEFE